VVRRPLIGLFYQPRMVDEYGAFGGLSIGRGNRSIRRTPAPVSHCPPQIPQDDPGSNPGCRVGKSATNHLDYGMALRRIHFVAHLKTLSVLRIYSVG
jgi:hypothetical protein